MNRRSTRPAALIGVVALTTSLLATAAPALAGPGTPTPAPAPARTSGSGTSPTPTTLLAPPATPSAVTPPVTTPASPADSSGPSASSPTSSAATPSGPTPSDPTWATAPAALRQRTAGADLPISLTVASAGSPVAGHFFEDLGRFAFAGSVSGDATGAAVTVCRLESRTWVEAATATVGADRSWKTSAPVTYAAGAVPFRATLGTSCPGSTGRVSNEVSVTVQNATVTLDKPVVKINSLKNPVISGQVFPARAGVRINLDILRSDKTFRVTQQTTTDSHGRFAKAVSFGVGRLNTYTTRAAYRAANRPRWEASRAYPFTRIAVLDTSSRRTTTADVAKTYRPGCPVGPSKLRTLSLDYYGLRDKKMHRGVVIIRANLVDDLTRAFGSALTHRYPIAQMLNPNAYGGNDPRQMTADNTSGFNCRKVTGNPYAQSPHSYGTALDVNTVENPYRDVHGRWWPSNGRAYIDRSPRRTGMLTASSYLTASLRRDHFFWGGFWNPGRDYQHFQR